MLIMNKLEIIKINNLIIMLLWQDHMKMIVVAVVLSMHV